MKVFHNKGNEELLHILIDNGVILTCNDEMDIVISDKDAERIPSIVERFAPSASQDYSIENKAEKI